MNPILHDMFAHQFWSDTVLWDAIGAHPQARDDQNIRDRLHHIHLVQRAFMWVVRQDGTAFDFSKPGDFTTFDDLRAYAQGSHAEIRRMLESVTEVRLADSIRIPWFTDPPLTISVTEALTQSTMHSHHHRGQNATRLRELGGAPPSTDLIVWYWKQRPGPAW